MTFSYSGNPKDSILDEIRFLIGDCDRTKAYLEDEEIHFAFNKFQNKIYPTSIYLCRRILMTASKLSDSMSGLEQVRNSQIQAQFKQRISDLEKEMMESDGVEIVAGGLEIPPKFSDFEGDNPRTLRGRR